MIAADLPALGQRRPGDAVRFAAVDWEEAWRLRAEMERTLGSLASRRQPVVNDPSALDSRRLLSVNLISGVSDGAVA